MISSRSGNGAPASVSSGIASAAASDTDPRMPGPADHEALLGAASLPHALATRGGRSRETYGQR